MKVVPILLSYTKLIQVTIPRLLQVEVTWAELQNKQVTSVLKPSNSKINHTPIEVTQVLPRRPMISLSSRHKTSEDWLIVSVQWIVYSW